MRPAGRCLTGNACVAQLIPNVPDRRLGVRIEDQLDGMDHRYTKLATQSGSNAEALMRLERRADS